MGYGYGGSQARRGIRRYNNAQVAHVWNAQTEKRGQSNNGNVYFDGPALYSYGSHFLTGYIMPDGVALLNADSYSVSTSGHQSDARGAVRNRATFYLAGLTELLPLLHAISAGNKSASRKREARDLIRRHAEALAAATRLEAGESRWRWNDETGQGEYAEGGETAGAYLTRLAGLPAASWPKLQREAAAAKAKREAAEAKAERRRQHDSAVRLADMPDSEWRRSALAIRDPSYHGHVYLGDAERRLDRLGLELLRALKFANANGFSKRRRETLKRRRREVAERKAVAASIESILAKRQRVRSDIATIRNVADYWRGLDELPADLWKIRAIGDSAESMKRLAESPAFPFATRRRLAVQAERMAEAGERMADEWDRVQAERREAERKAAELEAAEHKREWLAGNVPLGRRRFDAESGGAALRIMGNRLETSHGAEVPLAEAVRAFRFIKLCRERGRDWKANGERVRVGAFHVDSISAAGDMIAGCHSFTWPEIRRAAELAGVLDAEPSAEAVRETHAAA